MGSINLFDHGQAIHFSKTLIRVERGATRRSLGMVTTLWVKSVTITNNIPDGDGNITETIYVYQRINFDPSQFFRVDTAKKRGSYPTSINVTIAPENEGHDKKIEYIEGQPTNERNYINISINERFGADTAVTLFGARPAISNEGFYSIEVNERISLPDWRIVNEKNLTGYAQTFACGYETGFDYNFSNPAVFNHTRSEVAIDVNLLGNGSLSDPGSGPIKLAHLAIWRVKRNPTTTSPVKKFQTGITVNLLSSSVDPQFMGDTVEHRNTEAFAEVFSWNYNGDVK